MGKTIKDIIKNPALLFLTLGHRELFNWIDDKTYLEIAYRIMMGKKLNLKNPRSFSEKLQWLKLYNRKPEYTLFVDKYEVKRIVADIIGEDYIIPTLGVWNHFDEIDFDKLPHQFVLKCTHDSGGLVVCKDKGLLNRKAAKRKIEQCLKNNFFWGMREWPYKNVKPRIIAEKYMEDESGELCDYKLFCFGGKVKCFKIDFGRYVEHHANYYDTKGNLLPFGEEICPPLFEKNLNIPCNINQMIELAEKLSKNIPFIRVDFYNVKSKIYFGELTLFPASGMGRFTDSEWDYTLGNWIELPQNEKL